MPRLKQLSCTVQWADTGAAFQEYGTVYGDGLVESFIVVPNKPQPFTIHVRSLSHIYEGLAVVVFIDGTYQANRNRVNLKPPDKNTPLHKSLADFLLRQKEKPIGEGVYMGREWRFDSHNIVESLPQGVKEGHFDLLGTIEVLVLRCRARIPEQIDESASSSSSSLSSAADSDVLAEGEGRPSIGDGAEHDASPNTNEQEEELDGLSMLGNLSFGTDGTAEPGYHQNWDGAGDGTHYDNNWHGFQQPENRSYGQRPTQQFLDREQRQTSQPSRHTSVNTSYAQPNQRHVRFDLGSQSPPMQTRETARPPSYERLRPPAQMPPNQGYHSTTVRGPRPVYHPYPYSPHPTVLSQRNDNLRSLHQPPYNQIPIGHNAPPIYAPLPYSNSLHPAHTQLHNGLSIPAYSSNRLQPFHHTSLARPLPHLVFDPLIHPHGAAWPPQRPVSVPNPPRSPTENPLPGSGAHWDSQPHERSSFDASKTDWDTTTEYAAQTENAQSSDNNGIWGNWEDKATPKSGDMPGADNTEGDDWTNDNEQNQWTDDAAGQADDAGWQNDNDDQADNGEWQGDAAGNSDGNWQSHDVNSTFNENAVDEPENHETGGNDKDKSAWLNERDGEPTGTRIAAVITRALFGPHGQYYTHKPRGPNEPKPDAEEEPRYDIPRNIADATGSTTQVLPGSGYMYWKKRCAPQYIDSMEEPYARFVFKYRTNDQLERETGIKVEVEPTGDEAIQELQSMERQALIDMLLRAKNALGGKVPSPPLERATRESENRVPVAVDPPRQAFLKYKLPEPRQALAKPTSNHIGDTGNADHVSYRGSGGGGSGGGGGGGGGSYGGQVTSWDSPCDHDDSNQHTGHDWDAAAEAKSATDNWRSIKPSENIGMSWRRNYDGAADSYSYEDTPERDHPQTSPAVNRASSKPMEPMKTVFKSQQRCRCYQLIYSHQQNHDGAPPLH